MALTSAQQKLKKMYPELNDKQLRMLAKKVQERLGSGKKCGKGFFSSALKGLHAVTNLACKDKNPKWDYKPKSGENHQVLKNGNCTYRAQFSGQPWARKSEEVNVLASCY